VFRGFGRKKQNRLAANEVMSTKHIGAIES